MGPKGQRITDRGKGHQEYQDSFPGLGRKHALKDQSPREGQGGLTRTTGLPGLEAGRSVGHGEVHTKIWGHKENKEMKVERQ